MNGFRIPSYSTVWRDIQWKRFHLLLGCGLRGSIEKKKQQLAAAVVINQDLSSLLHIYKKEKKCSCRLLFTLDRRRFLLLLLKKITSTATSFTFPFVSPCRALHVPKGFIYVSYPDAVPTSHYILPEMKFHSAGLQLA